MDDRSGYQPFPTTFWSVVELAKDSSQAEYRATVNRLIAGYWKPVYGFIRRKGFEPNRAEDLTQGFFLRFFERRWIDRAEAERGRFRSYLLTLLVRFLADEGPRRLPRQQHFDGQMVSISSLVRQYDNHLFEIPCLASPESIFMREWAKAVVENTCRRLEAWCRQRERPYWYDIFRSVHFPHPGEKKISQTEIGKRLGLSRDQVRYGNAETSRKFAELIRDEVADQVDNSLDVEDELRELMSELEK